MPSPTEGPRAANAVKHFSSGIRDHLVAWAPGPCWCIHGPGAPCYGKSASRNASQRYRAAVLSPRSAMLLAPKANASTPCSASSRAVGQYTDHDCYIVADPVLSRPITDVKSSCHPNQPRNSQSHVRNWEVVRHKRDCPERLRQLAHALPAVDGIVPQWLYQLL